jgi:hypothetical protein
MRGRFTGVEETWWIIPALHMQVFCLSVWDWQSMIHSQWLCDSQSRQL